MSAIFKVTICSNNKLFISSLYFFLLLCLRIKGVNLVRLFNSLSTIDNKENKLLANGEESNIDVTFMGVKIEYDIFTMYDFFVPEVDVVCQRSYSNDRRECCRPLDRECALLVNSTTTCTNHITVDSESSICSKYYKLCCQAYFTKTKMMKPFKALHLKYNKSLLTFNLISKFLDNKLNEHNVTITENVKNFIASPGKMLHIGAFAPVYPIPEGWYFIEDGSNELLYSNAINGVDRQNMNKIGWFQYVVKKKELSRVSTWDLEKHLQVKLLDCHSNPPKYEWKLDAKHYVKNGLLHLPKNVEKVSEKYKDIANISINLKEEKIRMEPFNPPSVNFTLSNISSFPFMFTSSMKDRVLNLTITKGNGTFDVEMTSLHWTDILSFSSSSTVEIKELPDMNYDSYSVCISQKHQHLCEILFLIEDIEEPIANNSYTGEINCMELKNIADVLWIVATAMLCVYQLPMLVMFFLAFRKELKENIMSKFCNRAGKYRSFRSTSVEAKLSGEQAMELTRTQGTEDQSG